MRYYDGKGNDREQRYLNAARNTGNPNQKVKYGKAQCEV